MEVTEILKKDEYLWPEKLPKNPTIGDEEREQRKSKFTFATEETNSSNNVNDRLLPEKVFQLFPATAYYSLGKAFSKKPSVTQRTA